MLSDGLQFLQASLVENLLIENGPTLPAVDNNVGELFYLTVGSIGLYVYTATGWMAVGSSAPTLTAGTGINIVNNAINNTGIRSIVGDDNIDVTTLNGVATLGFTGVVPVSKGGTGTTSLPTGFLKSNGTLITSVTTITGNLITGDITGNSGGVTSTIPVSNGGTGKTSFTAGYVTTSGNALSSVATIPATDISGTVSIANGGTGTNSLPTGFLKSNGTLITAVSSITGDLINGDITGNSGGVTGIVSVANGGTGKSTFTAGYLTTTGSVVSSTATIPVTDLSGAIGIANGGTGRTSWTTGYVTYNGNALVSNTTISGTDISGTVANATTAATATSTSNITGGAIGYLHVQNSPGVTAFISPVAAGRVLTSAGTSAIPTWSQPLYDVGLSYGGNAAAGDVMVFVANRAYILPSGLASSYASAKVAATASTTITINKKAVSGSVTQIGTVVFGAGGFTGTFTFGSSQSFAVGDLLVFNLGTADSTLASVGVTLAGQLQ